MKVSGNGGPALKRRRKDASQPTTATRELPALSFPIVGIGASAGGLEAFTQLLDTIPPGLGMAFVLIQHLDPTHPSRLVEALARKTRMPVHEIQDGMPIEPGHVYVMAPNVEVSLRQGGFALQPRPHRPGKLSLPIDPSCALAANDTHRRSGSCCRVPAAMAPRDCERSRRQAA